MFLILKGRKMKFTKLEHSGCIIENNSKKLVCDPVEFEAKIPKLSNVEVIIITHKHGDHFQPQILEKIVMKNPNVRIFAPQDFEISEINGQKIEKVEAVTGCNTANFSLKFFGRNHMPIIPNKIPCANIGVTINDKIVNPGDSFDLPNDLQNPELLLVPSEAPWLKSFESMEYIRNVQPKLVVPVHNAVLSKTGDNINNNWLKMACDENGVNFAALGIGESIEI